MYGIKKVVLIEADGAYKFGSIKLNIQTIKGVDNGASNAVCQYIFHL